MKTFKTILHYWIAVVSLLGFLGGWVTLAHARKPISNTSSYTTTTNIQAVPTLPPLQPLNLSGDAGAVNGNNSGSNNNSIFNFQVANPQPQPQPSFGFPVVSTRGS
jgi:hypothetical protein